jgi:hypothetical protein
MDVIDTKAPEAGAPAITEEMIERGLEWLYAWSPEFSDGREIVLALMREALANSTPPDLPQVMSGH